MGSIPQFLGILTVNYSLSPAEEAGSLVPMSACEADFFNFGDSPLNQNHVCDVVVARVTSDARLPVRV
jgi:hypothetical protein